MFEGIRGRARTAALQAAAIEQKVLISKLRDAMVATERELASERKRLEDAERRGQLAREIPDEETAAVAERFAAKHRDRVAVLDRKLGVQREEMVLAERELEEMTGALRIEKQGGPPGETANQGAAWRDLERAGGTRPETDVEDVLLKQRMDREMREAAAEAQLAHLKKKLGKDKT